jgi:hypothetical protein
MPDPQEPRNPPIALPVDLVGEERDEAERIVRVTRRALVEAFERIGVDAVPSVPNYVTRSKWSS